MQAPSPTSTIEIVQTFIRSERADKVGQHFDARTDLIETGVLDSLFLMQLVTYLESEFAVTLSPDTITPENFVSLQKIVTLVDAHRAA